MIAVINVANGIVAWRSNGKEKIAIEKAKIVIEALKRGNPSSEYKIFKRDVFKKGPWMHIEEQIDEK